MSQPRPMTSARQYLFDLTLHGIKLGLDNIQALVHAAGDPHFAVPVIHVGGTNGKGSVCAMTAAMLQSAGYRVGRFTSPHLIDVSERFLINGEPIPEDALEENIEFFRRASASMEGVPTFFEMTTAIAFRYFAQEKQPHLLWDLYPLPGNKFDANNGIGKQFSMGLMGACNGWSEADEAGRAKIWEAHKQYTLEMHHFLSTDPAVPVAIREEYAQIGLCKDEFADYGHWSPQLYVREGRRMIGEYIVSQKDIMEEPKKNDAIVVSSFPIDSHDCQRVGTGEFVVNEGTIMPVRVPGRKHGYAYHIPYRAITPKAAECDNLLVPVALSCTHVGISSIRVEPTWMILGQSAGIAAAMSAKQNLAVQKLPYPALRERLLAQKQVLDLPVLADLPPEPKGAMNIDPKTLPGIVLDDSQADLKGEWSHSSGFKPHIGTGYLHDDKRADGQSIAIFLFKAPKPGKYDLRMAYSAHETRATKVPVTIESGERKTEIKVDQTQPLPAGEAFRSIGSVELDGDTSITVRNAVTDGFVILDALQLLPAP